MCILCVCRIITKSLAGGFICMLPKHNLHRSESGLGAWVAGSSLVWEGSRSEGLECRWVWWSQNAGTLMRM